MKRLLAAFVLFLVSYSLYSTHIVGGELTYHYNGGSSYTIILKLYRDCGPNTASFPGSVGIIVRGNNGATFSPSKDFSMSLSSVVNVPANLLPCAVPPNPMPCVQVGTYTKTVSNLPANFGGYHLYYQLVARNLSLTNINGACNCIGESFYAYIPDNTISSNSNSNAVFNSLPPLFLCVNQAFTINHSATDADGDSLVYSLYTPYNGDNGPGPLDPTFPSNTASFTPVVYLPGFTTTNPLGPSPFNLDPHTGILTGIPGLTGQFVVGIRVKEYRNGNFISQTLRDFQFNVLNCPSPPPGLAVNNMTVNNGCVKTVTAGGILASSAVWTSIAPGPIGAYNSLLTCTSACLSNSITCNGNQPPYVDFQICGTSTNCAATYVCDTFRVYFNPALTVSIQPSNPVLCFGQTSTTLTAIANGGSPAYNYLWNSTVPTQTISVGVGTYNIQLSDASGCPPVYQSISVTSYTSPITANAGGSQTVCVQNPLTPLSGTVTGASGGIWSGGTGTFTPNNTTLNNLFYMPSSAEISAGATTLFLTTTGNESCPPKTASVVINYMGFTGTVSAVAAPVSCFGGNNGSSTVTINGGTGPYTYTWNTSPVQSNSVAANLSVGNYSITVQNGFGCKITSTVNITQPLPLGMNSTITNVSCLGGSNGSVCVIATGGTPSYSYLWQPGSQTTSTVNNLPAGQYSVTVTDNNGCVSNAVYNITQPSGIAISASYTNVNCFGGSNASITTSVTGGTSPFTYSWMPNSSTSPSVTGLPAGTYTLLVTDNNGCIKTNTYTIIQPPQLVLSSTANNETCDYLNNGSITTTVSGGSPSYTYLWMPGSFTSSSINSLTSGTYSLTVTDASGCSVNTIVTISQPPTLTVSVGNIQNVSCAGGNNGSATALASGGTPVYSYSWSPIATTSITASNLTAGYYAVTVTDSKSCTSTQTVQITQPLPLNVSISYTSLICNASSNGAISVVANGGQAPYTHTLMPGNIVGLNFTNLPAGVYTIITSDANGCSVTNTVLINQPSNFSSVTSFTNSACLMQNGIASVSVTSGGVPPFTYNWSPSGGTNSVSSPLFAGSYTVTVTDNNGCVTSNIVNISDLSGPVVSLNSTTNVSCYGGNNASAAASFTGGTGPSFTYSWSPTGGNSLTATNLSAGTYVIKVTDSNGCIGLATAPLITQPSSLSLITNVTPVSCFGNNNGSATVSVFGGMPAYTYTWLPSAINSSVATGLTNGTHTVTIMDMNGCMKQETVSINQPTQALTISNVNSINVSCFGGNNGSATVNVTGGTPNYFFIWSPSVGSNSIVQNLAPGSYSVSVFDANNCSASATLAITQPTAPIDATVTAVSPLCFNSSNGTATVVPSGGTPSYSYTWSPVVGTGSTVSNLQAGSYNVTVQDLNGCQVIKSFSVTQPTSVTIVLNSINPTCNQANGSVISNVSGGIGPYTYTWNPVLPPLPNASNLLPGLYSVIVSDANGCMKISTATLVNQPAPAITLLGTSSVKCFGNNNGTASVSIALGTPPYTISWLPMGGNALSSSSLVAGTYTVDVVDSKNCVSSITLQITEPNPLSVLINTVSNVSCNGLNDGSVSVSASGGTPTFAYNWLPSGNGSSVNNLAPGTYTVNILDFNNCAASAQVSITEPLPLSSTLTGISNPICFNSTGSATIVSNGGTVPYSYLWSSNPVQNGNVFQNVFSGNYSVTITDANGCTEVKTLTLTNPSLVITNTVLNDTICKGQQGTLMATAYGGSGNYNYQWLPLNVNNAGTFHDSPLTNTSYTVAAFDQNGCSGTNTIASIIVYDFDKSSLDLIATSPICPGEACQILAQTSGNTGVLNYNWNTGFSNSPGIFITIPTTTVTYIVNVTNACGITISDSVDVVFNPPPEIHALSDTLKACAPGLIKFNDNSITGNSNDPITSWSWNFGDGNSSNEQNPMHTYPNPGTYSVTITVVTDAGCINTNDSQPIKIDIYSKPVALFSANTLEINIPYEYLKLTNKSYNAVSYNWNFGDGNSSTVVNPNYLYHTVGDHLVQLIATSDMGCKDTAELKIKTKAEVIFPNAFTPNSNGPSGGYYDITNLSNDIFFPYTSGVEKYSLQIFNRWGELIFESNDVYQGWDGYYRGQLCQTGVYVWKAFVKLNNGFVFDKTGDVTLLR